MSLGDRAARAAAVLAIGATLPAAAMAQSDASAGWTEMARCGAMANDAARHGCTDEVLRRHGLMAPPEARTAERRKAFGLDVPSFPHRTPPPKVVATAGGHRPVQAEDTPDRITVTLDRVSLRGDGKLVVRTTEGAVWRQVETDPVRPMPVHGQSMTIERTALGGYFCKPGKWTAFRCTREP